MQAGALGPASTRAGKVQSRSGVRATVIERVTPTGLTAPYANASASARAPGSDSPARLFLFEGGADNGTLHCASLRTGVGPVAGTAKAKVVAAAEKTIAEVAPAAFMPLAAARPPRPAAVIPSPSRVVVVLGHAPACGATGAARLPSAHLPPPPPPRDHGILVLTVVAATPLFTGVVQPRRSVRVAVLAAAVAVSIGPTAVAAAVAAAAAHHAGALSRSEKSVLIRYSRCGSSSGTDKSNRKTDTTMRMAFEAVLVIMRFLRYYDSF